MINIYYKTNLYSYRRTNNRGHWIGIKQGDQLDDIFCGNFITVKSSAFPILTKEAISQGHPESLFFPKEEEKKKSTKKSTKKSHKLSISIFN